MTHKNDEVPIRVLENTLSDEILILVPASVWDASNLADGIKQAVIMTIGQLPDDLDS